GHGLNQRQTDGFFALRLHFISRAGLSEAGQRIVNNLQRLFTARIVRSKDNEVASLACRFSHQRTLSPITITTTAENRDHPAQSKSSAGKIAGNGSEVAQSIVGMSIVHHYGERLAAIHFFESPWDLLEMVNGFRDLLERTSAGKSRGSRSQNVIDVDPPDQRCLNLYAAGRRDQIKLGAVLLQVNVGRLEVAILDSIQNHLLAQSFAALAQALAVFVIGIDH